MDITALMQHHQVDTLTPSEKTGIDQRNNELFKALESFISNKDILEKYISIGSMHAEYEAVINNQDNLFFLSSVEAMLTEFNSARDINKQKVAELLSESHSDLRKGISNMAQAAMLQADIRDLSLRARVKSIVRDIGDVAEGCIFPFLRFRAAILKIKNREYNKFSDIREMSFGEVLSYIESNSTNTSIHDTGIPLRLSQIRNVGQHISYEIKGDIIKLLWGKKLQYSHNLNEIELDITGQRIGQIFLLYKTAVVLFSVDHAYDYIHNVKSDQDEAGYTILSILAQDFILNDIFIEKAKLEFDVVILRLKYIGEGKISKNAAKIIIEASVRRYANHYPLRDFEISFSANGTKHKYKFRTMSTTVYRLLT